MYTLDSNPHYSGVMRFTFQILGHAPKVINYVHHSWPPHYIHYLLLVRLASHLLETWILFRVVIFPGFNVQSTLTVHLLSLMIFGEVSAPPVHCSNATGDWKLYQPPAWVALMCTFSLLFLLYNVLDIAINNIFTNIKAVEHFAHQVVNTNVSNLVN